MLRLLSSLFLLCLLVGCTGSDPYADLKMYMAEVKARPRGKIDPIPVFDPYQAFVYAATTLRGPFDIPVTVREISRLLPSADVKPDKNRIKEYLERFNIEAISMVGTIEQDGQLWSLINDGDGGVHRVKIGNYLGRNHGEIVETTDDTIAVIEIVPNGLGGWLERPKTLMLREKD